MKELTGQQRLALARAVAETNACGHCDGSCGACQQEADDLAPTVAKMLADAWDMAVRECHDLGWMHDFARSDALGRNPYR